MKPWVNDLTSNIDEKMLHLCYFGRTTEDKFYLTYTFIQEKR